MGLLKKMASVLVTASLLFGLVGTAFATTPSEVNASASRLQELGIVVGDPSGDMKLGDPITRAQLMKIMVWAFGQKDNASILKGAVAFPDTSTHWASGEIAIAKNIIVEKNHFEMGMPDGNFAPEGKVTAAQAVAFLMKFLGISPDSSKTWPNNYLDAAVSSGMISAAVRDSISATANTEATRGLVFFLADTAFAGYPVSTGKTVYTTYVKPTAPTLTVEASELTTTASKVTVSGTVSADAKAVYVGTTSNTVTVSGGKFSTEVTLDMGANNITVGATDIVGATTTQSLTVTRTVGVAATIDAPASITAVAGGNADLAIAVKDAQGNVLSDATAEVTSDLGTFANGVFTAGEKAGTGTATVTYGDLSVSVNVTVQAGELSKIAIAPATIDLSSGASQKFAATGADQFGNEVALTNAINWSSSKGVMGPDGTFGATQDATGTVTITATAGTVSGTATATVFGKESKVVLSAPEAVVANGESEGTITATVVDANGNVVKNYSGTINFASSASKSTSVELDKASVAAVNGVATTTFVANGTTGTVISASASGLTGGTVTYTPAAQVVTSISVEADPGSLAAISSGSSGKVTLTLVDQTGNDMLAFPTGSKQITVKIVSSDKTVAYFGSNADNTSVTFDAVSKEATINATSKVGGVSITGTVTAPTASTVTVGSASLNTLVVGDGYQLAVDAVPTKKAGVAQTTKVRVLDFNGNQLTSGTLAGVSVKRVAANGAETDLGTISLTAGVGTTPNLNVTTAGTYTLKVAKSGYVAAPDTTFTVTAADANKLNLEATPNTIQANGSSQAILKVTVQDAYGNKVTDGSYTVTLKKTAGNATAEFADTSVTTVNGEATVAVTSTTNIGTDSFTATATGLNGKSATVATAILGAPYKLAWGTIATNPTVGTDATVNVKVQDAGSHDLTYDNGRVVTLTVKDGTTVVGTFTGTTENGTAAVKVNLTTAKDGYTLSAESDSLEKVGSGTINFKAGAPVSIALSADVATLTASNSATADITVTLQDKYGNDAAAPTGGTAVTLTAGETTYGGFTSSWNKTATYTVTAGATEVVTADSFYAKTSAGTTTITATATGLEDGTLSLTSIVTGTDVATYVIEGITDTKVSAKDANQKYNVITVNVVDGNGNRITTSTANVFLNVTGENATTSGLFYWNGTAWAAYTENAAQAADKGQVKFAVTHRTAESLDFTVANAASSPTISKAGAITFVPGTASAVVVDNSDPRYISGDGMQLTTVKARIVDGFQNTVKGASGTINFSIKSGNDFAVLQSTSAPIVDGVATVVAQSKVTTSDSYVSIEAAYDVNADGTDEKGTNTQTFRVDATNPAIDSIGVFGTLGVTSASSLTPTANVSDVSGVASVKFETRNVSDAGVFTELGVTQTTATSGSTYTASAAQALEVLKTYELKVTVTDVAGRSYSTTKRVVRVDDPKLVLTDNTGADDTLAVADGGLIGSDTSVKLSIWTDADADSVIDSGELVALGTQPTVTAAGGFTAISVGTNTANRLVLEFNNAANETVQYVFAAFTH